MSSIELKEGDAAPDIELQTAEGEPFRLSGLRGRKVVLYFYPRANTPGCTTEACEFRDLSGRLSERNAVVVGVSPDAPGPQARFKSKFGLPFTLLCDVNKEAARAYGVWNDKIQRSTFLIDEHGRIEKIFSKVKAKGHAVEVLAALGA